MDEKRESELATQARRITHALADLDILFSLSKNTETGERIWDLGQFEAPGKPPVNARLMTSGPWVAVMHSKKADSRPDAEMLFRILKINLRVPLAKIGLSEVPGPDNSTELHFVVSSELPEAAVSAESLKNAIAGVLAIVRLFEALLENREDDLTEE
jgi:hypothetical protein